MSRVTHLLVPISLTCCTVHTLAQIDQRLGGPVAMSDFSSRYSLISADSANMHLVPDPAGGPRTVFELSVKQSDPNVYGALRTEIGTNRDYIQEGIRWYAMSVYFPGNWQIHPYPTVVAQLHTSQKQAVLSPPVSFVVYGANLDLELYANDRPVEGPNPASRANSAHQLIRLGQLKTQSWYCFVVRADWSHSVGNGSMKIWMNGDKVYEASNLYNSYETWLGNYAKVGIYMPGMRSVTDRIIYADYIHLAGPRSSFKDVADQTPCGSATTGGSSQ